MGFTSKLTHLSPYLQNCINLIIFWRYFDDLCPKTTHLPHYCKNCSNFHEKNPIGTHICKKHPKNVQKQAILAYFGLILAYFGLILQTFGHFCTTFVHFSKTFCKKYPLGQKHFNKTLPHLSIPSCFLI